MVVERLNARIRQYAVVPDEREVIASTLRKWCDEEQLDLLLTTGGTGLGQRDVTPEATRDVVEREVPAITLAMLFESLRATPYAMLTRATAGIRGRTLIVNLPGNPRAVAENLEAVIEVLPHAIDILQGRRTEGHGGHREHAEHREHARHTAPAEHREQAGHSGQGEHRAHEEHREGATEPPRAFPGIARNVGGPTC